MELKLNTAQPEIMHIDLNACFAMIEQQANSYLRGKPVGVTNRADNEWATIVAPSYEAKKLGVRCGTRVSDARRLAPGIIIIETDPPKYTYVHSVIKRIFAEYAPRVTMKSIDEGILDFRNTTKLRQGRSLESIGYEIKSRVHEELGEWMTVNVGIGTNQFLAKLAASLHKPDGLDSIDHTNLEGIYLCSNLMDLNGINRRFRARLNAYDIHTPYEFLQAEERTLSKQVFRSINGRHWHARLRGYEVDDFPTHMRNVGKQYVLHNRTNDPEELAQILYKLCYYISRRLKRYDLAGRGLGLEVRYASNEALSSTDQRWFLRHSFGEASFGVQELYTKALYLFRQSPAGYTVTQFSLTAYQLALRSREQLHLYETTIQINERIEAATAAVNDRYGDLTIIPARMLGTEAYVPDKIPFGGTRHLA
jgi:DNA polymerase-4